MEEKVIMTEKIGKLYALMFNLHDNMSEVEKYCYEETRAWKLIAKIYKELVILHKIEKKRMMELHDVWDKIEI